MNTLEVIEIGTEVILCDDIKAQVIAINIGNHDSIIYKCCWWDGRDRKEIWVQDFEIKTAERHQLLKPVKSLAQGKHGLGFLDTKNL